MFLYLVVPLRNLIIILLFPLFAFAQELTFIESIELDADTFIGVNSFAETFYIKDQVLYKQSQNETFNFKEFQLGKIFSVDIINPMNIAVYYQDFNTVVLLDNRLNETERIDFNRVPEFLNTSTATLAANNSLWVFNTDSQQLESYNYRSNNKVLVSQPITGEIRSQVSNINYCFILTDDFIRAYNIYGSLMAEFSHDGYQKIIQHNENLIAIKDNKLYYIDKKTQEISELESPEINLKDLQLKQDFLYIYDENQIQKFKITLPK